MTPEQQAAYELERNAAHLRKIELSMQRKLGALPSTDPRDRALLDDTPERSIRDYNPRRW